MNFYPFHIGDYASATRHLSWDEDCAYRRLLDVYYTTEKPLPLDAKQVCRLAVARTKSQRAAVLVVLHEFFEQTDAGWVCARAEAEIEAMRDKQAAGEERAAHESTRMSRYRERRAALFQALRAKDVIPPWDMPMKDLQALHDQHCAATATPPATPPATQKRAGSVSGDAPATAIPTPIPTPTFNSVPIGTDGAAVQPADMSKDELWRAGKSLLEQSGLPAAQCGTFVGKLVKDYGEQIVVTAVRAAVVERPADPLSYLKAACLHAVGRRPAAGSRKSSSHMGLATQDYTAGVNLDGTFA